MIQSIQPDILALLFIGAFLNLLFRSGHFSSLYNIVGARVGNMESLGLSSVASVFNTFLPGQVGGIARATYLKSQYSLPFSKFPVILGASVLFSLSVGGILLFLVGLLLQRQGNNIPTDLWILAILSAFLAPFLFWITPPERILNRFGPLSSYIRLFKEGWLSVKHGGQHLVSATFFQLLSHISYGFIILLAYKSIGLELPPVISLGIAVTLSISNLIIITPGNVGIQEFFVGLMSQMAGLTFAQGVAANAIVRVVILLVTISIAPASWYLLFFRKSISISKTSKSI